MIETKNYEDLKALVLSEGACLFGVALIKDVKNRLFLPPNIVEELTYAISFAVSLSRKILDTITNKPNHLYYFHYQRVNTLIDSIALKINDFIQKAAYSALPIPASQIIDWESQTASVSHRDIAYAAGLGWRGKNNLIVSHRYGATLRLGSVLTDIPLKTDIPVKNDCGTCSICINSCPALALSTNGYDKKSCEKKLKEFMKTEKIGQMVCGICVRACPTQNKEINR
jgi:epoxyqueuosine reductase QueG